MSVQVRRTRLSRQACFCRHRFSHGMRRPVSRLAMRIGLVGLVAVGGLLACSCTWAQPAHPYPRRVTVVRDASHLADFGWVRIDATDRIAMFSEQVVDRADALIHHRVYASLDATITRPNHIDVHVERVCRYTLLLNEALVDFSQPVTVVTNGHTMFEGHVSPSVETLLRDARRRGNADRLFPARLTIDVPS